MGFLAGKAETVAFTQLEMPLAHPKLEAAAEEVASFFTLMAVALLAVGARGEA